MRKLINAFAPTVPMWSVFADDEGGIFTQAIEVIAMVEDNDDIYGPHLQYWSGGYDGFFECDQGSINHLGYADNKNPKIEDWQSEISTYLKKNKERLAKK